MDDDIIEICKINDCSIWLLAGFGRCPLGLTSVMMLSGSEENFLSLMFLWEITSTVYILLLVK